MSTCKHKNTYIHHINMENKTQTKPVWLFPKNILFPSRSSGIVGWGKLLCGKEFTWPMSHQVLYPKVGHGDFCVGPDPIVVRPWTGTCMKGLTRNLSWASACLGFGVSQRRWRYVCGKVGVGDRRDVRCGNSVEICRDPNRKVTWCLVPEYEIGRSSPKRGARLFFFNLYAV